MTELHDDQQLQQLSDSVALLRQQVSRVIVGQVDVIDQLLICILARGHCILEGVPGLAKTLLVSTLARALNLQFHRIQFTPDLMPSDITGTDVLREDQSTGERELAFLPGPVFANVLLADEINRTPPKTQAALLEAMQEQQVSIGGTTHALPTPFFVLATQNPIEQEGTYPLPEAQLDRFLLKVFVGYPSRDEEREIYRSTTSGEPDDVEHVVPGEQIPVWQHLVRRVPISDHCVDYAMSLVRATRANHPDPQSPIAVREYVNQYVAWGAGPRAGQSLILAAKARAAMQGRYCVEIADLRAVAPCALRHRLVVTYAAHSAGETPDSIVQTLLQDLPERPGAAAAHGTVAKVFGS